MNATQDTGDAPPILKANQVPLPVRRRRGGGGRALSPPAERRASQVVPADLVDAAERAMRAAAAAAKNDELRFADAVLAAVARRWR